jgi:hypothetical protein
MFVQQECICVPAEHIVGRQFVKMVVAFRRNAWCYVSEIQIAPDVPTEHFGAVVIVTYEMSLWDK